MADIPSIKDLYNKIKTGIFTANAGKLEPDKDPFVRAMSEVQAKELNHLYKYTNDAVAQTFSQSATDEAFLKAIAFDRTNNLVQQKLATKATGQIIVVSSQDIPSGTQFLTSDDQIYTSVGNRTPFNNSFSVSNLQRVSGYAIATIINGNFGTGMEITFQGANETAFNGLQTIEVLSKDTIRYLNAGVDEVATGTITGSFFGCRIDVVSDEATSLANKTFTNTIDIIDSIEIDGAYITFDGFTGGSDDEDIILGFKPRINNYLGTPQNLGNQFTHQLWFKQNTIANFTNIFAFNDPLLVNLQLFCVIGQYSDTFYFTNFTNDELNSLKDKFCATELMLGLIKENTFVINPTLIPINISISGLSPNSIEMKDAINLLLREYLAKLPVKFYLSPALSEISSDKIKQIVALARDSQGTSPSITSLSVSGGVGIDTNVKKPILGTVSYA